MKISDISIARNLESRGYKGDQGNVEIVRILIDEYIREDYNSIKEAIDEAIDEALPY